jgi:ribonuclease VapC
VIVVDTSALMAAALKEEKGLACLQALADADAVLISTGTLAELLVVADRRSIGPEMSELIAGFDVQTVPLTGPDARLVAEAYARWGEGVHPAGLNLADCFAYALAKSRAFPLLYVGNDFARTDIRSALA